MNIITVKIHFYAQAVEIFPGLSQCSIPAFFMSNITLRHRCKANKRTYFYHIGQNGV